MDRIPVQSELIKSMAYDIDSRILEIELQSGYIHQYSDVPDLVYQGLLYSSAKDSYYQSMVANGSFQCINAK